MTKNIGMYNGSTWKDATHVYVYNGSTWKEATGIWVYNGSTWEQGWPPPTSASNWVDPGDNDGFHQATAAAGGGVAFLETTSTNRIYIIANSPLSSTDGYYLGYRVQLTNEANADDSQIDIQWDVSYDGAAFVSGFGGTYTVHNTTAGSTVDDNTLVYVSKCGTATGSVKFRVRSWVTNDSAFVDGTTDNASGIFTIWTSTSGSTPYYLSWE